MRGNEKALLVQEVDFLTEFPIPMRGNEFWRRHPGVSITKSWFPIPMRGNELQTLNLDRLHLQSSRSP